MQQGTVRWFDLERGFGFLAPEDGSAELFVHASEIVGDGGARVLREGQAVEFELGEGERGPQALGVRVTGDAGADTAVGVLGSITWYEPAKGYGFAASDDGGPEIFVHSSAIVTGGVVTAGQRVAFLIVEGERGPQAQTVIPLGPGAGEPPATDGADGTVSFVQQPVATLSATQMSSTRSAWGPPVALAHFVTDVLTLVEPLGGAEDRHVHEQIGATRVRGDEAEPAVRVVARDHAVAGSHGGFPFLRVPRSGGC
jgi:cold shock CspA family protein